MSERKRKTKVKEKAENLADQLNRVPFEKADESAAEKPDADLPEQIQQLDETEPRLKEQAEKDRQRVKEIKELQSQLFDQWESDEFAPDDFKIDIPVDSLESRVGFSSLTRQLHDSFNRMVAFLRSDSGGTLSVAEARKEAFHRCENTEEAKKIFSKV